MRGMKEHAIPSDSIDSAGDGSGGENRFSLGVFARSESYLVSS
jgi:hypothetical protein